MRYQRTNAAALDGNTRRPQKTMSRNLHMLNAKRNPFSTIFCRAARPQPGIFSMEFIPKAGYLLFPGCPLISKRP